LNKASSFHTHENGESSKDTNSDNMVENLNQSNQQLLKTIEELKAEIVKLQLFINSRS
jgi:predicted RNase H-like nuclease (RuvC/YqgF family)